MIDELSKYSLVRALGKLEVPKEKQGEFYDLACSFFKEVLGSPNELCEILEKLE